MDAAGDRPFSAHIEVLGHMREMREYLERSWSYGQYLARLDELLSDNKTTGENQSGAMVHHGLMNRRRMARLDKTVELTDTLKSAARELRRSMIWLIITEGWCGDAAQNIPVIEKIARASDRVKTRYILRDENLDLMDAFLTAGSPAIPKLISLDAQSLNVVGTWGSRPAVAQRLLEQLRASGADKLAIAEQLQRWYNSDKTKAIQQEFSGLMSEWNGSEASAASNLGRRVFV